MLSSSSSFQEHIDAGKNGSCDLILKERDCQLQYNKVDTQAVLSQIAETSCSGEGDMFSLKLT